MKWSWLFKIKINYFLNQFKIFYVFCNDGRPNLTGQSRDRNVAIIFRDGQGRVYRSCEVSDRFAQ